MRGLGAANAAPASDGVGSKGRQKIGDAVAHGAAARVLFALLIGFDGLCDFGRRVTLAHLDPGDELFDARIVWRAGFERVAKLVLAARRVRAENRVLAVPRLAVASGVLFDADPLFKNPLPRFRVVLHEPALASHEILARAREHDAIQVVAPRIQTESSHRRRVVLQAVSFAVSAHSNLQKSGEGADLPRLSRNQEGRTPLVSVDTNGIG